jgi:hypothetical protein
MACDRSFEECVQEAHPCFSHKIRLWREEGLGGGIALPDHADWTGPTVRERVAETLENCKRNGIEPAYAGRATLV